MSVYLEGVLALMGINILMALSVYAILAPTAPPSFSARDLTVNPAEVSIGEKVTVGATVENTGDLSGNLDVTFKVNDVLAETKPITLAGHSSQQVTFTTTRNTAGTCNVAINDLNGKFVVTAPAAA
jgi:hypothetical protein